jgi:hypothetical protein
MDREMTDGRDGRRGSGVSVGDEAAVVCLALAHEYEESIFVDTKLYSGAGLVVCEAACLRKVALSGR